MGRKKLRRDPIEFIILTRRIISLIIISIKGGEERGKKVRVIVFWPKSNPLEGRRERIVIIIIK